MKAMVLVTASAIACLVAVCVSLTKPSREVNRCVNQCHSHVQIAKDAPCQITHNNTAAPGTIDLGLSSELVITSDDGPLTVTHAMTNFECSASASVITCRYQNDPDDDSTCVKPWDCNGQKLLLVQSATV